MYIERDRERARERGRERERERERETSTLEKRRACICSAYAMPEPHTEYAWVYAMPKIQTYLVLDATHCQPIVFPEVRPSHKTSALDTDTAWPIAKRCILNLTVSAGSCLERTILAGNAIPCRTRGKVEGQFELWHGAYSVLGTMYFVLGARVLEAAGSQCSVPRHTRRRAARAARSFRSFRL